MNRSKSDSLLWRIECDSKKSHSYLFGSIHLPIDLIDRQWKDILFIINQVDTCFVEVLMNRETIEMQDKFIVLPDGLTWEDWLGSKRFNKLRNITSEYYGIDIDSVKTFVPFYYEMLILRKLYPDSDWSHTVDNLIVVLANEAEVEVKGLESPHSHFEVLSKIDLNLQARVLKSMIKNLGGFRKQIDKTIRLYNQERICQLYKNAKKMLRNDRNVMLYHRNSVFANTMVDSLKEGKSFFAAFGAGHLWGKFGVIAQLKQKGYKLKPINNA